jgi:hypothetical protein
MSKVRRLQFSEIDSPQFGICYEIYNADLQFLGVVAKKRVGAYIHWCFFPEQDEESIGDLWFTAGCMDEIREFMKNPIKYFGKYPETKADWREMEE